MSCSRQLYFEIISSYEIPKSTKFTSSNVVMFTSLNENCIPWCPPPLDCQALSRCYSVRKKWASPRQRLVGWAARSSHQPVHPPP